MKVKVFTLLQRSVPNIPAVSLNNSLRHWTVFTTTIIAIGTARVSAFQRYRLCFPVVIKHARARANTPTIFKYFFDLSFSCTTQRVKWIPCVLCTCLSRRVQSFCSIGKALTLSPDTKTRKRVRDKEIGERKWEIVWKVKGRHNIFYVASFVTFQMLLTRANVDRSTEAI